MRSLRRNSRVSSVASHLRASTGVALTVLGLAGWVASPAGRAQAPEGEASPDRSSTTSRLTVLKVGRGGTTRTVVALAKPTMPTASDDLKGADQGLLARELVRQALLIAARDELGLATRDEVLDDAPVAGPGGPSASVASSFPDAGASRVRFLRDGAAGAGDVLLGDAGMGPATVEFLPRLVERAEGLSRAAFPGALRGLGLAGAANKVRADAALPARVEERLAGLGFVENLAAVRDLHAAIRADGESPARLGALARGYAQLGVLSEYQWSPAHKAFKARALLYAQRLAAREPNSAFALRHRAFVRALVGRPKDALDDLAAARARPGAPAPAWAGPIEAFCKGDRKGLEAKGGPHAGLVALLRMMSLGYPTHHAAVLGAARDVLAVDRECLLAYDELCRNGGVSTLHVATEAGPEALSTFLPAKLKALGGLPAPVRGLLDRGANEPALVEALARAGASGEDAGEPSWGALAHLVREARFVQVARRVYFMRVTWSVPVDEYWAEARPFVAGHRFLPYLAYLALPPQQGVPTLAAFADRVDATALELSARPMLEMFTRVRSPRASELWKNALEHGDDCEQDLSKLVETAVDKQKPGNARTLLAVDPRSPFAMGVLIDHDWEAVKDEVPAWEKEVGEAPALLAALGRRYSALKRFDEAERYLARALKQSPDTWAYQMLAASYKARGQLDRWKATLDEFLTKVEDRGLDHARVQVEIANYYMDQKKWAEARPYAESAAESWSAWAMMCAARCAEGAEDWAQAELWTRRTSERYPSNQWMRWYLFCKRTGRGDAEAARAWTAEYLAAAEGRPDLADPTMAGYFYWMSGALEKAREVIGRAYQRDHHAASGINLALIADELGEADRRDALLKEVCEANAKFSEGAIYLAFRDAIADPGRPFDPRLVDSITKSFVEGARANMCFRVGMFLLKHGKPEDARAYLRRCADGKGYEWMNVFAIDMLRRLDAKKTP